MRNAGMDEAQVGIKIARRNIKRYSEQFCIPGVTSVFFSSFDSVVGDSLEFNQAN